MNDLSDDVSRLLKSPTVIVLLLISHFLVVSMFHVLRCSYDGCINIYNCYIFFLGWSFDHHVVSFLIFCNCFYFKVYFFWYEYWYSCFTLIPIFKEYLFPSLEFQSVCVLRSEVSLVVNIYMDPISLCVQPVCVFLLGHLIHLHLR